MVIQQGAQMLASDILNLTFFPKGTVLMYSSAAWNSASAGFKAIWHICNGETVGGYTTLNLVDKFIRGSTASGATGGTDTVPVPYHTHTASDSGHGHGVTDAGHGHTVNDPGHGHGVTDPGHNHNVALLTGIGQSGSRYGLPWKSEQVSMQTAHGDSSAINPSGTGISIIGSGTGISINGSGAGIGVNSSGAGIGINGSASGVSINNGNASISVGYAGSATADNKPAYCTVIFIEKVV